ncbi:unnamed protein product [Ambrosiozyma monospora]|uniref:Unnamed protein product n=1 Tax=Ambrosiozyma monospora TaxID=43982 RepID=A0ACB5TY75_AMBMO|nr:unnamed protein product [Ambrosiozyma monospora]
MTTKTVPGFQNPSLSTTPFPSSTTTTTTTSIKNDTTSPSPTPSLLQDLKLALQKSIKPILTHILQKYIFVAIGTILMLLLLYATNEIIRQTTINFPASVCLMLLLFALLSTNSWIFGEDKTQFYILRFLDIPCGFSLRWMNIYFTPPFVTLVLADKISVKEAFIIAAVFLVGYIFSFGFMAYFVWILQIVLGTYDHDKQQADAEAQAQAARNGGVGKDSSDGSETDVDVNIEKNPRVNKTRDLQYWNG